MEILNRPMAFIREQYQNLSSCVDNNAIVLANSTALFGAGLLVDSSISLLQNKPQKPTREFVKLALGTALTAGAALGMVYGKTTTDLEKCAVAITALATGLSVAIARAATAKKTLHLVFKAKNLS